MQLASCDTRQCTLHATYCQFLCYCLNQGSPTISRWGKLGYLNSKFEKKSAYKKLSSFKDDNFTIKEPFLHFLTLQQTYEISPSAAHVKVFEGNRKHFCRHVGVHGLEVGDLWSRRTASHGTSSYGNSFHFRMCFSVSRVTVFCFIEWMFSL
jgi:hypothetical protein